MRQAPRLAQTFRGFVFHINLHTIPQAAGGYKASEAPNYADGRATVLRHAAHPAVQPEQPEALHARLQGRRPQRQPPQAAPPPPSTDVAVTGTPPDKALMVSLTAPILGVPADQVSDLSTLMFGPLARGSEVSVR